MLCAINLLLLSRTSALLKNFLIKYTLFLSMQFVRLQRYYSVMGLTTVSRRVDMFLKWWPSLIRLSCEFQWRMTIHFPVKKSKRLWVNFPKLWNALQEEADTDIRVLLQICEPLHLCRAMIFTQNRTVSGILGNAPAEPSAKEKYPYFENWLSALRTFLLSHELRQLTIPFICTSCV